MKFEPVFKLSGSLACVVAACALAACSSMYDKGGKAVEASATPAAAPAPAPAPEVVESPAVKPPTAAETALAEGLKAYQAAQYRQAEAQLKAALQGGLSEPADIANANKHLAFIYCTSKRDSLCASAFKAAKVADPGFALSKAEAGHPMWARTYKKALGLK